MPCTVKNYQDFPTDKFSSQNENIGTMNTAPVVLLVEPSPILRSSLHDWLDQALAGHRILTAPNGVEALRLVEQDGRLIS
jgi:hypothetical protein